MPVFDGIVKNFITKILVEIHRHEETIPPSFLKKIPYDYVTTQDVVGYPECPPTGQCICPPDSTDEACPVCIPQSIFVNKGTKLFLTYFDQGVCNSLQMMVVTLYFIEIGQTAHLATTRSISIALSE
jgi:hypothetical protein